MDDGADLCPELVAARGASVATRYDHRLCAHIDVRTEEGLHAAHAGAGLVRQAVVDASARGLRSAELTLDVASPVSGAVLTQLRDLVGNDVVGLQVRRAGGTVLVEVELTARPTRHGSDARSACEPHAGVSRPGGRHRAEPSRRLSAA
ncbi:hypothetical protein [Cellulomonas sp. P5_C5]